jgi:hypothetical protein
MRGLLSIWQTHSIYATGTADLIEREVIELDGDTIEVDTNWKSIFSVTEYQKKSDMRLLRKCTVAEVSGLNSVSIP